MKIYTRQKHELSDSLVWLFRFSAAGWILALFETFGTKKGFEFLSFSANVMKIASTWSCRVSSLADVSNRGISCVSANDWATDVLTLFWNIVQIQYIRLDSVKLDNLPSHLIRDHIYCQRESLEHDLLRHFLDNAYCTLQSMLTSSRTWRNSLRRKRI